MIRFDEVSVTYTDATTPALSGLNLRIAEGELCLIVGPTGSGKTTLLRAINGLVPHFSGGTMHGRVTVAGRDTATHPPRELADLVGFVAQDPMSGFVTDTVEDELAYGMECLGLPQATMRRRVEETLDLLGIAELRDRPLLTLSGGQRQRVAIGSVLTTHPAILVLDEPTSALDPGSAEEVLAAIQRLVHDLGVTVVLAEHRLERVIQYADSVVVLPGAGQPARIGNPSEMMIDAPVAPPVVQLGRMAHWAPLPLSVRDARRAATPLRERLTKTSNARTLVPARISGMNPLLDLNSATAAYGDVVALNAVNLTVCPGEIVALMGRNGAGKSTLLSTAVGLKPTAAGEVRLGDRDPTELRGRALISRVGLVPQDPVDLMCADSVQEECRSADRDAGVTTGTTQGILTRLIGPLDSSMHPRDLSEGQRLSLALAIILAASPPLILLDEPTRGLDYSAKSRLVETLQDLAGRGHAVVLATHDVELVAELATRVVVLAGGEVVADGPTADVVVTSPMFAPQVAKILAPLPFLTVADVARAIA
jgi:energy-coupling factor transport system ATP-binding protein